MTGAPTSIGDDDRRRYLDALRQPDRQAALRLVDDLLERGVDRRAVLLDLVCGAQREVGARWQRGEWSVAQEHAATAVSDAVVAGLMATDRTEPRAGHVVLACVEDELHALPARIVAEVLQLSGWRVTYLGAATPPARLTEYLHEVGPDAVALSSTVATSLPTARAMIEAARAAAVPVVVGGAAFGPHDLRARRLGADAWAASATEVADVLAALPTTTTVAPPHDHDGLDDHAEVLARRGEVLPAAYDRLVRRFPPMADYGRHQIDQTKADLAHLLDFAATARYVPDDTVLFDLVDWLLDILTSRGVPASALVLGLEVLAEVVDDLPAVAALLRAASDRVEGSAAGAATP